MSSSQKKVFWFVMLLIFAIACTAVYATTFVLIGLSSPWTWILTVLTIPVVGRLCVKAVRQEVLKNVYP